MPKSAKRSRTHRGDSRGFSMVELAVSMCVMLILTAIAIPSLMQSFRAYQLNDAAARISDLLKFTRFEAVRRNTAVTLQIQQAGINWNVWADSNNNGTVDPTEKQILITGFATLLPAGGSPGPPSSASITATLGPVTTLTTLSGANNSVSFDARGAVSPLAADVFYIGSTTNPEFGYRAVILLPSGATQIWTAPASGPWQRLS
jgi:prepilin-type N-terminal cleavage/methylation domain-containing protein